MKRFAKIIIWVIPILLLIAAAGFVIWAETPPAPMPEAVRAMESDAQVSVAEDGWIAFEPTETQPTVGLIIYPGGRVDPSAYAPLARAVAEQGYLVVIVPMPLNLAVFSPAKASQVIAAYPDIEKWAITGHSLGGAMAANFISNNPQAIDGLALLAAYPASSDDLSGLDLSVISIFGTNDGLAPEEQIRAAEPQLPPDTLWIPIEGGNHGQFGWYGNQPGDNPATISREQQLQQIVQALTDLLVGLADGKK